MTVNPVDHILVKQFPILKKVVKLEPVLWLNPNRKKMPEMPEFPLNRDDMNEAAARMMRFRPLLKKIFADTRPADGAITSTLKEIKNMKQALCEEGENISGRLFLKCDNDLSAVGSIKARGGFYEVLYHAEKLALENNLITTGDNYEVFASDNFRKFFSQYRIGVGSTGNLRLSIGTLGSALGFDVTVYMSGDARQWKKDLLRERGAKVIEFEGDFSEAVLEGREKVNRDPKGYFVDDENSRLLFTGYSLAAFELQKDLLEKGVAIDADHPLFVYSPCGVGGSCGGIAFGLKQVYGDHVHCFFAEPTHSPAVLTGLVTGKMSDICVQDLGIDNKTEADGLAVGRSSNFATKISSFTASGVYTIEDDELYKFLTQLMDTEKIFLEPSATAGLKGPQLIEKSDYPVSCHLNMKNAVHIALATGGSMVPQHERELFYDKGSTLLMHHV